MEKQSDCQSGEIADLKIIKKNIHLARENEK